MEASGIQMNEMGFRKYLKRGGRTDRVQDEVLRIVREFEGFLKTRKKNRTLDKAQPKDLEEFTRWVERESKGSAKTHLWALRYYFAFSGMQEMEHLASELRENRITRAPFRLADFIGVKSEHLARLASAGIKNATQLLKAGSTPGSRAALSKKTGVPIEVVLELVKMSDLSRIFGVKAIRCRLYYDSGVDTVEKMAQWDPKELRSMLIAFVERAHFNGIAPLPKEAEFTIAVARKLPGVVKY